jgi:hypothetical protein
MMAFELSVNPAGVEDEYLAGLNRSFGHWGDRSDYRWDLERQVGARVADLMVLRLGGAMVAGSAVSYRMVRFRGEEFLVGIMTGSWTLPEARGLGAFTRIISESRRLVAASGGSLLIAFVTCDNASRRRLVAAGCLEVPTWYVLSTAETLAPLGVSDVTLSARTVDELYRAHLCWLDASPGAHPVYPSAEVWGSQFLHRPLPVERLATAGCDCLVERSADSDRVLWLVGADPSAGIAALLARAVAAQRQFFFFTVDAVLARAGAALGMAVKPGSITVLDAREAPDSPASSSALPGVWRLQGGDRA